MSEFKPKEKAPDDGKDAKIARLTEELAVHGKRMREAEHLLSEARETLALVRRANGALADELSREKGTCRRLEEEVVGLRGSVIGLIKEAAATTDLREEQGEDRVCEYRQLMDLFGLLLVATEKHQGTPQAVAWVFGARFDPPLPATLHLSADCDLWIYADGSWMFHIGVQVLRSRDWTIPTSGTALVAGLYAAAVMSAGERLRARTLTVLGDFLTNHGGGGNGLPPSDIIVTDSKGQRAATSGKVQTEPGQGTPDGEEKVDVVRTNEGKVLWRFRLRRSDDDRSPAEGIEVLFSNPLVGRDSYWADVSIKIGDGVTRCPLIVTSRHSCLGQVAWFLDRLAAGAGAMAEAVRKDLERRGGDDDGK